MKEQTSGDFEALNRALDQIDGNLTDEENLPKPAQNEEHQQSSVKVEEDYQKFLEEIRNNEPNEEGPENSSELIGILVQGLAEVLAANNSKEEEDFKNVLGDLENSREEKTDCVLDSYFRKENILEAIVATRDCFESSLKSSEFSEEKVAQYGRQLTIIEEMMHILEGTGDGKGRLVELAGQFQSLGELPEGVPSLPLIE